MKTLSCALLLVVAVLATLFVGGCGDKDFVVVADNPLRVVYLSPNDGSAEVALDTKVTAVFSEKIVPETVTDGEGFFIENIADPENPVKVEGTIAYDEATKSATFTPASPFGYSTTYRMVLTKHIRKADTDSSEGGELAVEVRATFRTIDPDDLMVVHTTPSAGAWDTSVYREIRVVFSHPVDPASVVAGESLIVEDVTADPAVAVDLAAEDGLVWNEDHTILTITPAAPFGYSRLVRLTLTTAIRTPVATASGGFLPKEVVVLFKTKNPPAVAVVSITPSGAAEEILRETAPDSGDATSFVITFSEGVKQREIDVDGDGEIAADEGGALLIEDVTEGEDNAVAIPCTVEWLDNGGDPAGDAGDTIHWDDRYLTGADTTIRVTPLSVIDYSRLIRITLRGDDQTVHPLTGLVVSDRVTDGGGQLPVTLTYLFRMQDPLVLSIVSATTGSGILPMPRTDTLVFTFSEGVAQDTVIPEETIIVEDVTGLADPLHDPAHGPIVGSVSFNADDAPLGTSLIGDDNVVTFTLAEPLPYGTVVRVVWPGSDDPTANVVKSDRATDRGGQLPITTTYLFESETTPDLIVTGTFPGDGEKGKPIDGSITINFNRAVDCTTLVLGTTVTLAFDTTDPEVPGAAIPATITPACAEGDTSITIVPDTPIKYSRDVVVTLTDAVATPEAKLVNEHADPLMGHLRGGYTFRYSTMDPPPLGVVTIGTGSGHFTIPRTDTIIVGFSEGIRQSSAVLGETVIVEDVTGLADPLNDPAHGPIAGTLTYNADDAPVNAELIGDDIFMTFTPETPYQYGTLIRVTIPGSDDPTANVVKSDRATVRGGQHSLETKFLIEVERLEELRVIATSPAHDNRDVPHTATQITVTFNYAPDCTTINDQNIFVTYDDGTFVTDPVAPGDPVGGSWDCIPGNATVTFTADAEFGYGRDFLVYLTSDVRDERAAGGAVNPNDPTQGYLVPPFAFGFGTEHLDKLFVVSSNAAGSSAFDPDLPIIITFNQPAACATITDATLFVNKGTTSDPNQKLAATITCADPASVTIQIAPDDADCDPEALCYDTDYTVTIDGGADGVCSPDKTPGDTSDDGCIASPAYTFSFHTAKQGEFVAFIYPPNGANGVPLDVMPTVTFSAPVNTASVESDLGADADGIVPNICLLPGVQYDCSDPLAVEIDLQWTAGETVATLKPKSTLMPDSDYTVVVSRDIQDIDGRTLTGFYTSTFHTGTAGLLLYVVVNNSDDLDALTIDAYFREDVDVASVNGGTFYVTYENEFGGTTVVPGTITWNIGCDTSTNAGCTVATFTPDIYALYSCGEKSGDPQFSLPLNTEFTVHVSTYIRNANWNDNPLHVEAMSGGDEFLHTFSTPPSIAILSVKYRNAVVGLTNLSGADEVPVNAEFVISFREKIDPTSANGDTLLLEDDRGIDGAVTAASSQFAVAKRGTFLLGRDEGKMIEIFGTEENDGLYLIETVIDDRTVTLSGVTFSASVTDLNWARYWNPADLTITVENEDTEIHVTHAKELIHHSDYLGFHASVTAGSNVVTIPTTSDNYRVATYRDLGKYLFLYGLQSGNTRRVLITGVNEAANTLTTDTTFAVGESDIRWRITDDRDYHRLIIKGRTYRNTSIFLRAANGNPFAGISRYLFYTSPETHLRFSPDAPATNVLENPLIISSRALYRDSLTHETIYLVQGSEINSALFAVNSSQPLSFMVIPMPALVNGAVDATLSVTSGVWDYRGNPVIAASKTWGDIGNAPATTAITPNGTLNISPADGSVVRGDQHFTIKWPDGGSNHRYSMAPASINEYSVYLDQINKSGTNGTVVAGSPSFTVGTAGTFAAGDEGKVIETYGSGTAGNNGRRTIVTVVDETHAILDRPFAADQSGLSWRLIDQVPFTLYFVPEQSGNIAEIYPTRFLRAGAGDVRLTIRKNQIANIYTIASTDPDDVRNYTVETTVPTVAGALGQDEAGAWISLAGATGIASWTMLMVSFNEPVDPASFVMGSTVTLTDTDGTAIGATISVTNTLVVIRPNAPLVSYGNPYTLTMDGITDTAGNALAAPYSVSFEVEETPPVIVSVSPANFAAGVSVNATVRIAASEPLGVATITRSTTSSDGSFRVTRDTPPACGADAEDDVFGCLALDYSYRRITFVPLPNDLHDETVYTLTVAGTVADLAGNMLGADFTSAFDTVGGDDLGPVPLCADIDLAGGQVIDLYFSEAIDMLTADETTIFIYEVETGVVLAGAFTLETVDGYPVVRFTATSTFAPGVRYGVVVTKGVHGTDGNPLVEELRTFFTGTL